VSLGGRRPCPTLRRFDELLRGVSRGVRAFVAVGVRPSELLDMHLLAVRPRVDLERCDREIRAWLRGRGHRAGDPEGDA
jgi:hypothetical protein